ncbi:MAG: hypothetical protein JSS02_26880 [Planctomycetes bacterium]|nr:hypothetical protein [Planctomycetota bacterium]
MTSGPVPYSGTSQFHPGDGWTVQSMNTTPMTTSEPYPVPATSGTVTPVNPPSGTTSGWTNPSNTPTPAPVPPPVSFNRR